MMLKHCEDAVMVIAVANSMIEILISITAIVIMSLAG